MKRLEPRVASLTITGTDTIESSSQSRARLAKHAEPQICRDRLGVLLAIFLLLTVCRPRTHQDVVALGERARIQQQPTAEHARLVFLSAWSSDDALVRIESSSCRAVLAQGNETVAVVIDSAKVAESNNRKSPLSVDITAHFEVQGQGYVNVPGSFPLFSRLSRRGDLMQRTLYWNARERRWTSQMESSR